MGQNFDKFRRPERPPTNGQITDRDLEIIEAVLRYRFSPTSELARLVGGHFDVAQRRLRKLWEQRLVNRFAFPGFRTHSEFIYYLDNRATLELLMQRGRLALIHPQMEEEIRLNREADYAGAAIAGQHMKLGFLQHSLMISRMHFMLEMGCRSLRGQIDRGPWHQGAELRGHKVDVPEIKSRRVEGSNEYVWEEHDNKTGRLPVEPDALFTLRFPARPPEHQLSHFCYEADRGSMPMADMLKKFRAYYHFIKRQQKHKGAWGVHPIRAVLVETTDEQRARKLMELSQHPAVNGGKRSALFWFIITPVFTSADDNGSSRQAPVYLHRPEIIFDGLWALPDLSMRRLSDCENSGPENSGP